MKKILSLIIILFLSVTFLCGCEDENRDGLVGTDVDLIGTWQTGGGSFKIGDSIRFNPDYTCDFFWSHSSYIRANGTWDRTYKNQVGYVIVITIGEIETTYIYDFFDSYKTLRLKLPDIDDYIYYSKK